MEEEVKVTVTDHIMPGTVAGGLLFVDLIIWYKKKNGADQMANTESAVSDQGDSESQLENEIYNEIPNVLNRPLQVPCQNSIRHVIIHQVGLTQ